MYFSFKMTFNDAWAIQIYQMLFPNNQKRTAFTKSNTTTNFAQVGDTRKTISSELWQPAQRQISA